MVLFEFQTFKKKQTHMDNTETGSPLQRSPNSLNLPSLITAPLGGGSRPYIPKKQLFGTVSPSSVIKDKKFKNVN